MHPCAPAPLPRTVAAALLLSLTVAAHGPVAAGVVVGPGGNVGFDSLSAWQAVGFSSSGQSDDTWQFKGETSSSRTVDIQGPGSGGQVSLHNVVDTRIQGGPVALSSAATVGAYMPGTGRVAARGWSSAIVSDLVLLQAAPPFTAGFLSLTWQVDGTLLFDMTSKSGQWLNATRGVEWAHMARAEVFVSWKDPVTGAIMTSRTDDIGRIEKLRDGTSLSPEQLDAQAFLRVNSGDNPQTVIGRGFFGDGVTTWQQRSDVDVPGALVDMVALPVGLPVEVRLGLGTFYNALWDLDDFGMLDSGTYANFAHTAELVSVQLFNADGTPFVGEWALRSQRAGIDYPELIVTGPGGSVPLPATLALVMPALGWLGRRTRRPPGAR